MLCSCSCPSRQFKQIFLIISFHHWLMTLIRWILVTINSYFFATCLFKTTHIYALPVLIYFNAHSVRVTQMNKKNEITFECCFCGLDGNMKLLLNADLDGNSRLFGILSKLFGIRLICREIRISSRHPFLRAMHILSHFERYPCRLDMKYLNHVVPAGLIVIIWLFVIIFR